MQEQKTKKGDTRKYKWTSCVTLTKPEGEMLDKIISDNGCANLSQLCKKIVKGEVALY
ncbi:MAG: hypothetical protein RR978_04285 [Oscillospiraceae bacterium]